MSAAESQALQAVRAALRETPAWIVGGLPRDRALAALGQAPGEPSSTPPEPRFPSREEPSPPREPAAPHEPLAPQPEGSAAAAWPLDIDVVLDGPTEPAARAIARAAPGGAACFELSEEFAGWRVVARDGAWQVDVQPLRGGSLAADLALRDFTVNALAQPLQPDAPLEDPLGGLADLAARRLRQASPHAFADDSLRVLRLVRLALDLGLEPDSDTARAAAAAAPALERVAGERLFMELRRILASPQAPAGLARMDELGITAAVLPEVHALHGVRQSRFHHRDVHGHTLEALQRVISLQRFAEDAGATEDAAAFDLALGERRAAVSAALAEPLADQLTRGEALRWGALLHDAAKPLTAAVRADGRVTFMGHDLRGAELARDVLARLRVSERLRAHVAALVRHHLRLGFLVHEPQQPLPRRTVFDYLTATSPVEIDVTLLSIADRLATRGERSHEAIAAHLRLARAMLADALRWRAHGPPTPLWRGDELAEALGIATGPQIGELLHELAAAQYAGEVATREQALAHVRAQLGR